MEWFRLYHEARNDRKLGTLTDAEHRVWFDLMCLASESKEHRGTVSGYTTDLLALEVAHGSVALLVQTVDKLKALQVVRLDGEDDDSIVFIHWAKRQYDNPSDAPDRVRERVRKHRETQDIKEEALHSVTVDTSRYESLRNDQNRTDSEQNRAEQTLARDGAKSGVPPTRVTAPAAVAAEKGASRKMWDALGLALGHAPQGNKSVERGRWNKAIASLLSDGETPEGMSGLVKLYHARWPEMECTAMALAANCSVLRAQEAAPTSIYDSPMYNGGWSKEEADEAARKEAARYKPPPGVLTPEQIQQLQGDDHRIDLATMTQQLAARPPIHKNGPAPTGLKRPTYRLEER